MAPSDATDVPTGAVVVGIDGSPQSEAALSWAAVEARRRDLPLHLIHARESPALAGDASGAAVLAAVEGEGAGQYLADAVRRAEEIAPGIEVTGSRPWGGAARVLVAASEEAAVVVLGTRGRGRLTAAVLGTVSMQTAAHARCPVVVVRSQTTPLPEAPHVVAGVDGSPDSVRALRFAFESAAPRGTVTALATWWIEVVDGTVVTTPESAEWATVVAAHEARVREAVGDLPSEFPDVTLDVAVRHAHASEALIAESERADLLVVGSRGHGGFPGLMLGSVTQHMLTGSACPVAVVSRRS